MLCKVNGINFIARHSFFRYLVNIYNQNYEEIQRYLECEKVSVLVTDFRIDIGDPTPFYEQFGINNELNKGISLFNLCYIEGNEKAENLYKSLGFETVQTTRVYRKFTDLK